MTLIEDLLKCMDINRVSPLLTDTEVITYITDYLLRKKEADPGRDGVSDCGSVSGRPVEHMPEPEKTRYKFLRNTFGQRSF